MELIDALNLVLDLAQAKLAEGHVTQEPDGPDHQEAIDMVKEYLEEMIATSR